MSVTPTSVAAGVFTGLKNKQFAVTAEVLARKILLIGQYDATKTAVVDNTPVQVLSPEDVANQTGFGFMLHRLAIQAYKQSGGLETWIIPQPETTEVVAAGEIDFTGSTGILAGTLALYIAGDRVAVTITDAMTIEQIADAVVAAITADDSLPVTAAKVAVTFEVTITAKSKGLYGNDITIEFNLQAGEALPTGVTAAVTDMASGTGVPDIQDALDALGTGDAQNEKFFTDVIHGYGQDATTLTAIATYNGLGNDFVGNYAKTVARPFRSLNGDNATGTGGLTALLAISNARKSDRTNGIITIEGSPNHPAEVAAQVMALMARTNNLRAEESYIGKQLSGIFPGDVSERWSSDYANRDTALKQGISSVLIENGVVTLQNVATFYHPNSISLASNAFLSMRNISIIQNLGASSKANFSREKWQSITIVDDVAKVSSSVSREKVRDVDSVIDDLVALAKAWEGLAWIFTADFTIEQLAIGGLVVIRAGNNGFDMTQPVILSGEGGILNTDVQFDASSAILTA